MAKSTALLFAVLSVLVAFAGCNEDSPTAVGGTGNTGGNSNNTVTVNQDRLDFGTVCVGKTKKKTFEIEAPATNEGVFSGNVTIVANEVFKITKGAGPYELAPGEKHLVEIEFDPPKANRTSSASVEIGQDGIVVTQTGFGSEYPWVRFFPGGELRRTGLLTNTVLLDKNPNGSLSLLGVSYKNPSWHSCADKAWVFDGNPVTESWVEFEVDVPAGTKTVLMAVGFDASSDCAQLLMQIDGKEHVRSNFGTACTTRKYRFDITPGDRKLRIGTDQQGVTCYSDISLQHVTFTFEGRCLTEDEFL